MMIDERQATGPAITMVQIKKLCFESITFLLKQLKVGAEGATSSTYGTITRNVLHFCNYCEITLRSVENSVCKRSLGNKLTVYHPIESI